MEIQLSTSTRLDVKLTENIRLVGQRHSDRRSGSSVWETYFMKWGTYRVRQPLGTYDVVTKWAHVKGTHFKGIRLAGNFGRKADILEAINKVEAVMKKAPTPG